jgi:hypothetical protein
VTHRLLAALAILLFLLSLSDDAEAKRRRRPKKKSPPPASDIVVGDAPADAPDVKTSERGKEKVFDFTGISIEGKIKTPQLLYFLGRARQELERASLESRTFIPEMVKSIEEEGL